MYLSKNYKFLLGCLFMLFLSVGCNEDDDVGVLITDNSDRTVAEAADRRTELSSLIAALRAADGNLYDVLGGAGPFTLFAPSDAAFADLAGALGFSDAGALLEGVDGATLATILTYHVVPERVTSGALEDGGELATVQGETVQISLADGVKVLDKTERPETSTSATVTEADDLASNGVIHIIDKVLLPQSIIDALAIDTRPTILQLAVASDGLSILEAAVLKAGLDGALSGTNNDEDNNELGYTVFAPTDDAFVALLESLGDDYNSLDDFDNDLEMSLLSTILTYHVLPVRVAAAGLAAGDQATLAEVDLGIVASGASFALDDASDDNANITATDIDGSNGVVHTIDKVLLPPAVFEFLDLLASDDLAALVGATPSLSILEEALVKTELAALFVDDMNESFVQEDGESDEDFAARRVPANFTYYNTATVFAPNNDAFVALLDLLGDDYNSLDDFDTDEEIDLLKDILLYHVAGGSVLAEDLSAGDVIATSNGGALDIIQSLTLDALVIGDASNDINAGLLLTDLTAKNGVAHVVDKVLLPQSAVDFITAMGEEEE